MLTAPMRALLLALDGEAPRMPTLDGRSAWATADALAARRLAREVLAPDGRIAGFVLTEDGVWTRRMLKREATGSQLSALSDTKERA